MRSYRASSRYMSAWPTEHHTFVPRSWRSKSRPSHRHPHRKARPEAPGHHVLLRQPGSATRTIQSALALTQAQDEDHLSVVMTHKEAIHIDVYPSPAEVTGRLQRRNALVHHRSNRRAIVLSGRLQSLVFGTDFGAAPVSLGVFF